jgi:hypothetical protein
MVKVLIIFCFIVLGSGVVVYGVWFIWVGLGDALSGASALGGLAGPFVLIIGIWSYGGWFLIV